METNKYSNFSNAKILNNYVLKSNEIKEEEYLKSINSIEEKWKIIKINDKNTHYMISNHGNVRNCLTNTNMKLYHQHKNYVRINLSIDGEQKIKTVHRLVAEAFIPIPKKYTKKGYTFND